MLWVKAEMFKRIGRLKKNADIIHLLSIKEPILFDLFSSVEYKMRNCEATVGRRFQCNYKNHETLLNDKQLW